MKCDIFCFISDIRLRIDDQSVMEDNNNQDLWELELWS